MTEKIILMDLAQLERRMETLMLQHMVTQFWCLELRHHGTISYEGTVTGRLSPSAPSPYKELPR
jgi:hypothetical protein